MLPSCEQIGNKYYYVMRMYCQQEALSDERDERWWLSTVFENTYIFFKIQNTRFLRFLEMTYQNVEIFIKVSEWLLYWLFRTRSRRIQINLTVKLYCRPALLHILVRLHTWPSPSVSTLLHLEVYQIASLHCAFWNNKQLHIGAYIHYIKLLIKIWP